MARSFFNAHKAKPGADFRLANIESLAVVDDKQRQPASILSRQYHAGRRLRPSAARRSGEIPATIR